MLAILRGCLLTALFLLSIQAKAQYRLQSSNNPIIEKMTQQYKGKDLGLADLDNIVREISQDGLFQVVYVEEVSKNNVVIRAQQSMKINKIQINGQRSFKEDEIIDTLDIELGQVLTQLEITQAIDRIKALYESSGYYNFDVNYRKDIVDDGLVLNIDINEKEFCIIEDIQVFSKNEYLNRQIQEVLPQFLNKNYQKESTKVIEKRLNELLLENRFLTAKIQNTATVFNENKTRVKLKFTINNAIQYEFIFNGNKFFSHFDLIKQSEIGTKFLYLTDSSSEIVDAIKTLYFKNGFPKANIQVSETYFSNLEKRVFVLKIDEGPRIRIGRIDVVGKISREKSYYESLFREYLAEEAHSVFYVREDVEHAAEEMVTHLKRSGHLQAELMSMNTEITPENTATVTVQIDEGILTYVRQILFRGAKSFSNIELKNEVKIDANKPLNILSVEDSFDLLEDFYKERGFLEFKIKNRNATVIQYKKGQPYADIVYEVSEGPKIFVKDIRVTGLKKTASYVVTRELDFKKGDLLTLSRISDSTDRLEKSGLFGKVDIRSLEQGKTDGQRTIVVEVEERKPGLFSSGIGVLNEGRLTGRGYVGVLYNNLWGKARALSARVDLRYQDEVYYLLNRTAFSYYEPYLTENRLRGRVTLVRDETLNDFIGTTIRSTNQIRFSTEKEFTRHFRFTYNAWNFSNQETFRVDDKKDRKIVNIATTGPVMELDYRNDPFVPKTGSYSRLELEYADPLLGSSRDNPGVSGLADVSSLPTSSNPTWDNPNRPRADQNNEINYFRSTFLTTHYVPLTKNKRWVWANSLRGGYLKNVSSREDSGVPQVRGFFLGGASTIRGFSIGTTETVPGKKEICLKQGLIDFDQPTSDCELAEFYIRDDSAFLLFKSELRFPLSGSFGGLIFYDGGAVYIGDFTLEDPYRDSVGFGFSIDTPVASFVIEMGYKLDRKLGGAYFDRESDFAVHIAIGTF